MGFTKKVILRLAPSVTQCGITIDVIVNKNESTEALSETEATKQNLLQLLETVDLQDLTRAPQDQQTPTNLA